MYEVIALLPLSVGAVQETLAEPSPAVVVTAVGLPGTVGPGVTLFDGPEAAPVPEPFVAVTVNV